MQLKQKILNSINNGRLNPTEGIKKWYNYNLSIQKLIWFRNIFDGYNIDVYDLENNFLDTIKIEIKPVIEFGCVHNKMILYE